MPDRASLNSQLPGLRPPLLDVGAIARVIVARRQEPRRVIRKPTTCQMRCQEICAAVRAHDAESGERAQYVRALDRQRADKRAVLARLAVVAAVDETLRSSAEVRRHRRQHARGASNRCFAIMRVEALRPDEFTRLDVVRPDDVQLVPIRPVDGTNVDAPRKRCQESQHFLVVHHLHALGVIPLQDDGIVPDEEGKGARDGAARVTQRELGVQLVKERDRKSTRLNSSHMSISYAVFCLKKKKKSKMKKSNIQRTRD